MKRYFGRLIATVMLTSALFSPPLIPEVQAENEISRLVPFQGRLHGSDGQVVSDGVYDLTFTVYDTPTGGTAAWSENHSQVSVIHGYVNVLLGAVNPLDQQNYANQEPLYDKSKTHVDFTEKKYLGISINGGAEMFPRSQLVPSFHAYTANHANHATNADIATNALNADKLDGYDSSNFATAAVIDATIGVIQTDVSNLEAKFTNSRANDSENLDGYDSAYFLPASESVGQVAHFLTSNAPVGWLELNGQQITRTSHPRLFAHAEASGNFGSVTQFQWVDSDTIALPDLRGYHLRAWSNGSSIDSGRELSSVQNDQNKEHSHTHSMGSSGNHNHSGTTSSDSHSHTVQDKFVTGENYAVGHGIEMRSSSGDMYGQQEFRNVGSSSDTHNHSFSTNTTGNHTHSLTINNSGGSETRVKNVAAMICIKY